MSNGRQVTRARHVAGHMFGADGIAVRFAEVITEHLTDKERRKVVRLFTDFAGGVVALDAMRAAPYFHAMLLLWERDFHSRIDVNGWSPVVSSHFHCLITAHKRKYLRGELWRQRTTNDRRSKPR